MAVYGEETVARMMRNFYPNMRYIGYYGEVLLFKMVRGLSAGKLLTLEPIEDGPNGDPRWVTEVISHNNVPFALVERDE